MSDSRAFIWLSELLEDPDLLEPPKAIVPRIVWKERLTLLAAREKCGKSTLASAAAAAVSSGRTFLGTRCEPANVLIIALEEHPNDFVQRLIRFGADPERIAIVTHAAEGLSLVDTIWKAAEETAPDLIVWDTLGAFANLVSGKSLEPGDAQGWTTIMAHIVAIARAFGASLLLHHSRKSDGKYRDSTAIGANVDVILEMRGEGDEPRTIKGVGRFDVPETMFKLEASGLMLLESDKELQQRVLGFIKTHPRCSMRQIREAVDAKNDRIDRARDELVKNGAILNVGTQNAHQYTAKLAHV